MSEAEVARGAQIADRGGLPSRIPGTDLEQIIRMIENGEEASRIYTLIVECAGQSPSVTSAALVLPSERTNNQLEVRASHGKFEVDDQRMNESERSGRHLLQSATSQLHKSTSGIYNYFDIVCLGAPLGYLVVTAPDGLSAETSKRLHQLAFYSGAVYERHRLSNTLQHFLDRVQVLNELNQLIVSNAGLQRIIKSLARESAFRFAADVSVAFLVNEDGSSLEPRGGYGCAPSVLPAKLPIQSGIIGQVMRLGGHLAVSNLQNHSEHGLDFAQEIGIKSINACCLEVRGEPLGALLIGFRRETTISPNDLTRFEEFAQGAAVAITNARNQERLQAYAERLEDIVSERTADLAVQTSRAEEANQAKSQFLANMSHELRTPLTAIVGYSSVLADGIFGPLNDKQVDAMKAISRSSDHLKTLIDDVLNLARIESGKEVPEPANVLTRDLLQQVYKLMLQNAIGKGVTLCPMTFTDQIAGTAMYCDSKHLYQIIINLMSNAVKYTPKGGQVTITAEIVGDKMRVSIQDTGVGMSPAKLEKLFERFERGEDTYSKSQEGTGIGLNLTRRLVELNGGRISVESVVGKGSTFSVFMPLARAGENEEQSTHVELDQKRLRLDGLSALVVDDSLDTCEVLKHILEAAGASVVTANSVKEGVSRLAEHGIPDILLTDLAMPGDSGLSLIHHVRAGETLERQLPIIVLSACAFENDRQAALKAGATLFLPKPFRPSDVIVSVRQLTLNAAINSGRGAGTNSNTGRGNAN